MNSVFLEKRNNILGKEFYTNNSGKCFVLDYKGCNSILVAFYDPFCIVECAYGQLKDGRVSNPILPNVVNKGYLGVGSYNSVTHERLYYIWRSMLDRVYNDKRHLKQPTYRDVEVCKEWLCFQNFAKWCETQEFFDAKDDKGNRYEIDKDLLIKGNKQYSPDACCFVPKIVNSLLLNAKKSRGIYPIGVSYHKSSKKFSASFSNGGNQKHLGMFVTPEEAFQAYKEAKELFVIEKAEDWRDKIEDRVYQALLNYSISIDD